MASWMPATSLTTFAGIEPVSDWIILRLFRNE